MCLRYSDINRPPLFIKKVLKALLSWAFSNRLRSLSGGSLTHRLLCRLSSRSSETPEKQNQKREYKRCILTATKRPRTEILFQNEEVKTLLSYFQRSSQRGPGWSTRRCHTAGGWHQPASASRRTTAPPPTVYGNPDLGSHIGLRVTPPLRPKKLLRVIIFCFCYSVLVFKRILRTTYSAVMYTV